jgi:hypothetical protein
MKCTLVKNMENLSKIRLHYTKSARALNIIITMMVNRNHHFNNIIFYQGQKHKKAQ